MKSLYLLFLLLLTTSIFSQNAEDYIYELPYVKHFSYKDYGMHTQCWGAAQDSSGMLYISNNDGVAIYDGVRWIKIPMTSAWSLNYLDSTMYVSNERIFYIEKSYNGEFKTIPILSDADTAKYHITPGIFQKGFTTKDKVYFSNLIDLVEIKNKKIQKVYDISDKRVVVYDDEIIFEEAEKKIRIDGTELVGLDSLKEICAIKTYNKKAYIIVARKGIYSADVDSSKRVFKNIKLIYSSKLLSQGFSAHCTSVNNTLLMPLNIGGLLVYNIDLKKELYIEKGAEKNIGTVNALYITKNNNIIAITYNGFYLINNNSRVRYLKHNKYFKNIITSFVNYNNNIYVTTLDGLYQLKKIGNSNKYSIKKINKDFDSYLALKVHNNKLYVSGRHGISLVDENGVNSVTEDDLVFGFIFSEKYPDILYTGTRFGINIYKYTDDKFKLIHKIKNSTTNVFKLFELNDYLWFEYSNTEVARLNINNFNTVNVYDLKSNEVNLNLVDNDIYVSSPDNKVSHYFDNKLDKFKFWNKYTQIINNDTISYSDFQKISDGRYFTISNKDNAITKIISNNDSTTYISYKETANSQYFSTYFDSISNKFWVGSSDYILTVDNNNTIHSGIKFKTYIKDIIINDTINNTAKILKRKSKIRFLFSSNLLYKSTSTLYSYKLEGYDNKWSEWSKEAFARYTNLSFGNYTFKVKSKSILGEISDVTEYKFEIKPAFYQTRTALFLGAIILILIIYLIVYLNSKRLKAINQKLEKQVKERTKEIQKQNFELEKLSIVAQETDNSVLIYDANGNLEWINEGEIKNFGYTLEQIWEKFGRNIIEISFYPKINEVVKELKETKKSIHYNSGGYRKDGVLIWTRTTLTPILDEEGNIIKIIAIDSDITEVKQAEEKIKLQNTLINHSIEYAKRIQTAVLPSVLELKQNTKSTFIIYKPKDIVSGDFYWFFTKNEKTIIVSADCTGHGVPGGFMSMIGNTILNNLIKEKGIFEPNKILDSLNEKINAIVNKDAETGQTDGMDLSLALIDRKNNVLELASANQNIFFIKDNEIFEFYGDIWSIGGVFNEDGRHNFTSKKYKLNEITHLYFSTDGYYDQFGGKENKKLMKDIFIDLIIKNYKLPMENQKQIFEEFLSEWKQDVKQTDDIQVIGILL